MNDEKAYLKIQKARTALVLEHPFFASLAMRLSLQEDPSCHTAWTDGKTLGYNPHYINILSPDKLVGLTAHIVMHPACGHHKRRNGRDEKTWNMACDYAINSILLDAGFTLPDGYLFNESYEDKTAETIFSIIAKEGNPDQLEEPQEQENEQEEEENKDDNQNQEQDTGEAQAADEENEDAEEDDQSQGAEESDPGLAGEVRDENSGAGAGDSDHEDIDWDDAVLQAAITARGTGHLPGGIARMIDERIRPTLGWRALLQRFVGQAARSDYSWMAPNRRYLYQNLYLPSLKNNEVGKIVVALDTSGSIAEPELAQFAAEIQEIANAFSAEIHVIHCDTAVVKTEDISPFEAKQKIVPKGGGGTDYRPVFRYIEDKDIKPCCLLYLTDLECLNFPKDEPCYPLLWVKTGDGGRKPPFGDIIHIDAGK